METLNVIGVIVAATIIALTGIAAVAAGASLLLVQSASATTDITMTTTTTTAVEGEQEAVSSTTTITDNVSNAVLDSLFLIGEDKLTNFNPINETYTEVSYAGNRTIMPPDSTTMTTINATETGNLTLNLQPNGITLVEGQSLLVTQGANNNGSEQENATALLVDLNGVRPDDPRSSTGVAFFSTNSTGQLAFLDNMIAIYQVKASQEGTAIRMWEWKGAELPFDSGSAAPSWGNQTTTITGALEEEEETISTMTTTTNNNVSNAVLGSLFSFGEGTEATVNQINGTYSVISYSGNRIIMPPNTTGVVINTTETGNLTVNLQPNGLSIQQGQAFIVTEDGAAEEEKKENATLTFVMLSRTNPDGTGDGTSPTFFSTNSTGRLAFLNNMVAIGQTEFSPEGARFREWEWKGGTPQE